MLSDIFVSQVADIHARNVLVAHCVREYCLTVEKGCAGCDSRKRVRKKRDKAEPE